MNLLSIIYNLCPNWEFISIYGIILIYGLEALDRKRWTKVFDNIRFTKKMVGASLIGLSLMFVELAYAAPPIPSYATSLPLQILLWMIYTHFRSFAFYSAMIYYLWHKWDNLLSALYVGWFGIAVIELSFIPQHLLAFHIFLGIEWYGPFLIIMVPFLYERKNYRFTWKVAAFFAAGIFIQYFSLIWLNDAMITIVNGVNTPNMANIINPSTGTWLYELLPHIMKTLMTMAFCYVKKVK